MKQFASFMVVLGAHLMKDFDMAFLKAIIFGAIGTLTETSELQRQAFNRAFAEAGYDWRWDADTYRDMVSGAAAVVGGSDRIAHYAEVRGVALGNDQIEALHAAKSQIFQSMMADGGLPLNPGVEAVIADAKANNLPVAFASTTSRANIDAMLTATRPALADQFDLILSGDDASAIKPAPDIYLAALERLRLDASDVIAIEDSAPSMAAALAAGIATIVVPGKLWAGGAFDGAAAVLPDLTGITMAELGKLRANNALAA
jgi:HAD superfamily hydrolase (TIGR01509 family)